MRDRLHDGKRVAYTMTEFVQQQCLTNFPLFAMADVMRALQHETPVIEGFELQSGFDRNFPAILGLLDAFAIPIAAPKKLVLHQREKLRIKAQDALRLGAARLFPAIAIKLFATAIPIDYAIVEIPYKDGLTAQFDKTLLVL